ncbi:MAG TPA: ABC transporter substrate-binding protein [Gammaproteobacteria bacterium]|nr:ABC transporter substrate-binding protein [Gammaproteobacteria bacterium]
MSTQKKFTRRQFVKGLGAGSLVAGSMLAGCTPEGSGAGGGVAVRGQRLRWKLATTWPPNFPIFQESVERFAKDVRRMSGGRLTIQVFAGGELVPPLQTFDAVSQGSVEMGHGAAYYWAGKIPAAQFFTAVPFGMNAQGMNAWLYSGGGLELWHEVYAPHKLIAFPMGNTGVQMGGWFRQEISSTDDLKGLKMRIPGLGGKVMAKVGVNPVLMAGGEIYTALERGTIDATEWVGPFHDLRLGLYRAARYYYYPGWHEPGPVLELTINKSAWDQLPRELQMIIQYAAAANNVWMLSEFEARNLEALTTLREKHHVQVAEFPAEVLEQLKIHTAETLAELAASDALFAKVYQHYTAFQRSNAAWSGVSELAYARAAGADGSAAP